MTSRRAMVPRATRLAAGVMARGVCAVGGLRVAGQAHEQFLQPVALGAHRAHPDAGGVERGEHAVEVHRARHLQLQRVVVRRRPGWCPRSPAACAGSAPSMSNRKPSTSSLASSAFIGPCSTMRAVVDDREVAAQALGFLQVMGGEDDRGAGGVDLLQRLPHAAADLDVDAGGGLVEDQQARPRSSSRGRSSAGASCRRTACGSSCRALSHSCASFSSCSARSSASRARHAVEPGVVHADVERLLEHVEVDFLRHQPDQAHRRAAVGVEVDAEHLAPSPRALVDQRADDADQRALAGAVGARAGRRSRPGRTSRITPFSACTPLS